MKRLAPFAVCLVVLGSLALNSAPAMAYFTCTMANGDRFESQLPAACEVEYPSCSFSPDSSNTSSQQCQNADFKPIGRLGAQGSGTIGAAGLPLGGTSAPASSTPTVSALNYDSVNATAADAARQEAAALVAARKESAAAISRIAKLKKVLGAKKTENQAAVEAYRLSGSDSTNRNTRGSEIAGSNGGQFSGQYNSSLTAKNRPESGVNDEQGPRELELTAKGAGSTGRDSVSKREDSEFESYGWASRRPSALSASKTTPGNAGTNVRDKTKLGTANGVAIPALVAQVKKNSSLKDRLRKRLEELVADENPDEEKIAFLEEVLEAADHVSPEETLTPLSVAEAFGMDSEETRAEINRLLAELGEPAELDLRSSETLFERIALAHKRSIVRGNINFRVR